MFDIRRHRWMSLLGISVIVISHFCHVFGCKMHKISFPGRLGIVSALSLAEAYAGMNTLVPANGESARIQTSAAIDQSESAQLPIPWDTPQRVAFLDLKISTQDERRPGKKDGVPGTSASDLPRSSTVRKLMGI